MKNLKNFLDDQIKLLDSSDDSIAIELAQKSISLKFNTNTKNVIAQYLFEKNKHIAALKFIEWMLNNEDFNDFTYFIKANIEFGQELFISAIKSYLKSIEINDKFLYAHFNLANCYKKVFDYNKAISHYKISIELNSNFIEARYNLATTYNEINLIDKGKKCYIELLNIKNDFHPALYNLGLIYFQNSQFELALKYFNKCTDIEKLNFRYLFYNAITSGILGDNKNNKIFLQKIIGLKAKKHEDILIKANTYIKIGDHNKAFNTIPKYYNQPDLNHIKTLSLTKNSSKLILKNLGNLNIIKNKGLDNKPMIMISADLVYAKKYLRIFLNSIKIESKNFNILIHLMINSHEDIKEFTSIVDHKILIAYEIYNTNNKSAYTTRRFLRIQQIVNYFNSPAILLDIDCKINGNIDDAFNMLNEYDVGIYKRDYEITITQAIAAGFFYASPSYGSNIFTNFLVNYIGTIKDSKIKWFTDQLALLATSEWAKTEFQSIKIFSIPNELMSFKMKDNNSLVISLKGNNKNFELH